MTGSEPAEQVRLDKVREANERRLIEAAQRDPARFGEVYENYFELVYAYVARRTRDRDAAEDFTAEVFRKALENLPKFKWTGAPFAAWLFRIASNLIADRTKRSAREGKIALSDSTAPVNKSHAKQTDLEAAERQAQLSRIIEELGEDQKRVLAMRFAEEKSIREIAVELGRSEGAIKQLQFRALKDLRTRLAKQGDN